MGRPAEGAGLIPAGLAVLRRPSLWGTAVRQAAALATPGWWERAPHLPLPAEPYLAFRLSTQYGDAGHQPDPEDAVAYLRWCKSVRVKRRAS